VAEQSQPASAQATSSVESIVRGAARKYGLDENYFVHIAMCESAMNPNAVNYGYNENGNPSGLFQHLSGYFPARATKYGYSADVFDAYSNANTTAAMFSEGLGYLWECK
jgi:soluble lytic murein transglycosylase-like protein